MKKATKLTLPEPEAAREIHAVRRRIQRRAEKIGWAKYPEGLNSRPSLVAEPAPLPLRDPRRAEQLAADFQEPPLQLATIAGRLPPHHSGGKDEFVAERRRDGTASFQ